MRPMSAEVSTRSVYIVAVQRIFSRSSSDWSKSRPLLRASIALPIAIVFVVLGACGKSGSGGGSGANVDTAIFYLADADGELNRPFATSLDGDDRIQLARPSVSLNSARVQVSPDGEHIAYILSDTELYLARTDRRDVTLVTRFEHDFGRTHLFRWSPDGARLAFIADLERRNCFNVYVMNVDEMTQIPVTVGDVACLADRTNDFDTLTFSPLSDWITYSIFSSVSSGFDLHVSRLDGTERRLFSGSLGSVFPAIVLLRVRWSPDGRFIAYVVQRPRDFSQAVSCSNTLLGINTHDMQIGGRNSVRVTHSFYVNPEPFGFSCGYVIEDYEWSPNSDRLAYLADPDGSTDPVRERLYTATPGVTGALGSSALEVSGLVNSFVRIANDWRWSPNGDYLSYVVEFAIDDGIIAGLNTYDASAGGPGSSNSVRITAPLSEGFEKVVDHSWAPDSSRVFYISNIDKAATAELYRSEPHVTASSELVSLSVGIDAADDVGAFEVSPDGARIAFSQRTEPSGPFDVYLTALDGNAETLQISGPPVEGGQGRGFELRWSADANRVGYITDANTIGKFELYTAGAGGTGSTRVSGRLADDGDVDSFEIFD